MYPTSTVEAPRLVMMVNSEHSQEVSELTFRFEAFEAESNPLFASLWACFTIAVDLRLPDAWELAPAGVTIRWRIWATADDEDAIFDKSSNWVEKLRERNR